MKRSELEKLIQVVENWVQGRDLGIVLPILRRELERDKNRWTFSLSKHVKHGCDGCLFFGCSPNDPTDMGCNHGSWAGQLFDATDCPCQGRSYVRIADATSDDYDNWAFTGQPWSFSPAGAPQRVGTLKADGAGSPVAREREGN
jgi:hypothetical protein